MFLLPQMGKLQPDSWLRLVRMRGLKKQGSGEHGTTIGVLSCEVAIHMSNAIQLWHSLADGPIARLRNETINLQGVRKLVSEDDDLLLDLVLAEITNSIVALSRSVALLGKRCSNPVLRQLDIVFVDLIKRGIDHDSLVYTTKKMERKVQKMERLIAANKSLYEEMEALVVFEQRLRKKQRKADSFPNLVDYQHNVALQRQKVICLQESSIWGRSYDYTVRLLARSIFTINQRINEVFGFRNKEPIHFSPGPPLKPRTNLVKPDSRSELILAINTGSCAPRSKMKWLVSHRPFSGCAGGVDSPVLERCTQREGSLRISSIAASEIVTGVEGKTTLGEAALALHYANVIIVIEKLVSSPHLMVRGAREDLYSMLPSSIRAKLRVRLKSYAKNLASAIYDPILAAECREAVTRILEWLAPLAHDMIRWQSERNFEKKHLESSTNVFLLQTLYFASQVKTEAAITDLLVGLNYLWRFRRELNAKAVRKFVGSRIYDDCLDLKG